MALCAYDADSCKEIKDPGYLLIVSLQVQQMTATVQLVEALGGGWDVSDLPSPEGGRSKV